MTSIKQELDQMLKRCMTLCGTAKPEPQLDKDGNVVHDPKGNIVYDIKDLDKTVKAFMTTLASADPNPKEIAARIVAAWDDPSGKLQRELDAVRMEQIGNFIVSESTFRSAFYNIVTLGPDEVPFYQNETRNEVRVAAMGEDGKPEHVRIVRPQERTAVGLYSIASDVVRYKTQDIYRGDVSQSATGTIDIARDMRIKLDRIHYALLQLTVANGGCYGAFSTEQARSNKATRIYVAHSNIASGHLPTTNTFTQGTGANRWEVKYYDPSGASIVTGFRPAVLLLIEDYCNAWGNLLPNGQNGGTRLVPTGEIIVPSMDIINLPKTLLMLSNSASNDLQNQIQQNGYMKLFINGRTWTFISDVTIPTGFCYPRFNLLPGISYSKPSWDKSFTKRDDEQNWEERWARSAYGCVLPSQYRPRGVKIGYNA